MATHKFGASLANYSREFSEASHIFLKNGLWRVSASLASPRNTAWRMSQVWRVHATWLGKCRRVWRVLAKQLAECREFGKSRVFLKKAILASTRTRQKWWVFGEYSRSLNSRASCHCLVETLVWWISLTNYVSLP